MAGNVIEAALKITGTDAGASAMLAQVAANIKRVDEAAAHNEQVQQLGKRMAELKTQMEAVGQLKTAETNLAAMQTRAAEAAGKVAQLKEQMAGVAAPTAAMATAMERAEVASLKANAAMLRQAEAIGKQRAALAEMGVAANSAASEQERLARAFADTARAADITMRAEQQAAGAAKKHAGAARGAHGRGGHGGGFDVGGAIAGVVAAHSFIHGMEGVLETYREFDKETRYQRLVMGLTPEQQKPLVEQAIHGGATSKFNDIQWLEAQREIASRGYGEDQVLAFAPIAARLGQAFDVTMPEAVKSLEGSLLGFRKDTDTMAKAMAAAERTADIQVKASKIGGLNYEDVTQLYKYGAAPAKMAHLSEESLLAYGVISKKSNMNGDEAGTAFRALAKNLLAPTADAKTAMLANGIDFSRYQRAPKAIDLGAFTRDVAMKYGVQLNAASRTGLARIFSDPKMLGDPARFVPAVAHMLKETLGKQDAKSSKAIAGDARKFRDDSVGGVDTNALMAAIMAGISKSPQMANAIFGSKQGGRIYAALGDPKLYAHILEEVTNESKGFSGKVSEGRMAGFDGAVAELQGSVKNLQSAIGRAIDSEDLGALSLTNVTREAGHLVQSLAEANPLVLGLGTAATGFVSLWGAGKLLGMFTGATALKGSAVALDEAAAHLMMVGGGPGNPLTKVPPVVPVEPALPGLAIPGGVTLGAGALFLGGAAVATEIVKKSLEAQEAGHGGLWAPATLATEKSDRQDVADLKAERDRLAGEVAKQKALEKIPGTSDAATIAQRDRIAQLDAAIDNKQRSLDALHPTALPSAVPLPPEVPQTFRLLPPAAHGAADALDRMKEREDTLKDSYGLTGFVLGQFDASAAKAALALASLASFSGGGGGGSGVIQAAYHPGRDGFGGGGRGGPSPLLRGALPHAPNPYVGGPSGGGFVPPGAEATTAGMRQNNLGNIGYFGQHMAGLVGPSNAYDVDHSIARFATQDDGIRAAAALALSKFHGGRHTIWDIIAARGGWTPAALGPGASVNIARAMGLGNHDAVNLDDQGQMVRFLHGLAVQEHGQAGRWYTEDRIRAALRHEHPALAAPALPRREVPRSDAPVTSAHNELIGEVRKMTAAVERGGLHRVHVALEKGLTGRKTYQRGSVGATVG